MEHPLRSTGARSSTSVPAQHPTRTAGQGPPPGDRIRAARASADLSREQLAERIGSSPRTVRRLEDGGRRATTAELRMVAKACDVPRWFLAHGWSGWQHEIDG